MKKKKGNEKREDELVGKGLCQHFRVGAANFVFLLIFAFFLENHHGASFFCFVSAFSSLFRFRNIIYLFRKATIRSAALKNRGKTRSIFVPFSFPRFFRRRARVFCSLFLVVAVATAKKKRHSWSSASLPFVLVARFLFFSSFALTSFQ